MLVSKCNRDLSSSSALIKCTAINPWPLYSILRGNCTPVATALLLQAVRQLAFQTNASCLALLSLRGDFSGLVLRLPACTFGLLQLMHICMTSSTASGNQSEQWRQIRRQSAHNSAVKVIFCTIIIHTECQSMTTITMVHPESLYA